MEMHTYQVKTWVVVDKTESGQIEAVNKGPVSVSIEVREDLQFYKSGIYHSLDPSCGNKLNHGKLMLHGFEALCQARNPLNVTAGWHVVSEIEFDSIFTLRCALGWL